MEGITCTLPAAVIMVLGAEDLLPLSGLAGVHTIGMVSKAGLACIDDHQDHVALVVPALKGQDLVVMVFVGDLRAPLRRAGGCQ